MAAGMMRDTGIPGDPCIGGGSSMDRTGPGLGPPGTILHKCDKCAQVFFSELNCRRHMRVHRSYYLDKDDLSKHRDAIGQFWAQLPSEQAFKILSVAGCKVGDIVGSKIERSALTFLWITRHGTQHTYVRAGMQLEHLQAASNPASAEELFTALDDASENTFLIGGTSEIVARFVHEKDDERNVVASLAFLIENNLVTAWKEDQTVKALEVTRQLVAEEDAAQKREKKRLKKKRQRERKARANAALSCNKYSAQAVGNAFVLQYYNVLHQCPQAVHRFYMNQSCLTQAEAGRADTFLQSDIHEKVMSLGLRAEIKTVDCQDSYSGSVLVTVTGSLPNRSGDGRRGFVQFFFLLLQKERYFVLNDIFRYLDEPQVSAMSYVVVNSPLQEHSPTPESETEHGNLGKLEDEEKTKEEFEQDQGQNHWSLRVAKGENDNLQFAQHVPELPPPAPVEKLATPVPQTVAQESPVATALDSAQGDGKSIYIKNLPMTTTVAQLDKEFGKFGKVKPGTKIKKNVCYASLEFEDAVSARAAIQSSTTLLFGSKPVIVKEKSSRGCRGRSSSATAPGGGAKWGAQGDTTDSNKRRKTEGGSFEKGGSPEDKGGSPENKGGSPDKGESSEDKDQCYHESEASTGLSEDDDETQELALSVVETTPISPGPNHWAIHWETQDRFRKAQVVTKITPGVYQLEIKDETELYAKARHHLKETKCGMFQGSPVALENFLRDVIVRNGADWNCQVWVSDALTSLQQAGLLEVDSVQQSELDSLLAQVDPTVPQDIVDDRERAQA